MPEQFDLDAALSDESTPAGLRKWAENVQKQNRTLTDELGKFKADQRSSAISGALKAVGVNEGLARFYPADKDANDATVAEWLKENSDVFGVSKAEAQSAPTAVTPQGLDPAVVEAMRTVQAVTPATGNATPTLEDRAKEIDGLKMRTQDDRTKLDDFNAMIRQMAAADQQTFFAGYQR